MMDCVERSVLVVGGGLTGLSAAIFLAWRGVDVVLVERHLGSSPHPRAKGFTPRTLEHYRVVGLADRVPQASSADARPKRTTVDTLAGTWQDDQPWTPGRSPAADPAKPPPAEISPCRGATIAQDALEAILREHAVKLGADVRFGTEMTSFEQSETGVTATLKPRNGEPYQVKAQYLVAADGSRSPIRETLRIGRWGRGLIRTVRSVLFRADLDEYLQSGVSQFVIQHPGYAAFLVHYGDRRWALMLSDDEERDADVHKALNFSGDDECDEALFRSLILEGIGKPGIDIEILATGRWEQAALIADRFSDGRIFLAGDAAHQLPPTRGGYGINTGIDDVNNLAWKLAAVLSGESTPQLLETYDPERRAIALLRHEQIFVRPDYKAQAAGFSANAAIIDDDAMEFGQLYRSAAVLGADEDLPRAQTPEQWKGQPGTRAPHLWVSKDGNKISILDLLQRSWVLFAEDELWREAAAHAGQAHNIKVEFVRVGSDIVPSDDTIFKSTYGLKAGGASLIRPDGHIAWRSADTPADPISTLSDAVGAVASTAR